MLRRGKFCWDPARVFFYPLRSRTQFVVFRTLGAGARFRVLTNVVGVGLTYPIPGVPMPRPVRAHSTLTLLIVL